jgi:hypothetical protein
MLPFHRREAHREPTATTEKSTRHEDSMWHQLVRFVIDWIKISWRDILTMAILGAASLGVSHSPRPRPAPPD